jgi:hypothetical protein
MQILRAFFCKKSLNYFVISQKTCIFAHRFEIIKYKNK